jgi:H+/gluconate symporter-like permease
MVLTYGGVSLFVVVFIIYPIGYAIYRSANIPRTLLPAVIAFGSFGITMTSVPGSPQIQNLIPMEYFGTSATAGPVLGLAASLLVFIPGYIYLDWRVRKAKKDGLGFEEVSGFHFEDHKERQSLLPMWLSGLLPLVVVFLTMNILRWNIVISLLAGILVCCILRWRDMIILTSALTEGANGSVMAIMNTACAVVFGSVIRILPGFALLTNLLTGNISSPVSLFFSESMSICALSGATGSASGGLSIVLEAFSSQYLQIAGQLGISPELLHRFASIAAGSFDKLPHNGAVITLLVVSQCTHKDSYKDIFVVSVIIPMLALFVLIILWGLLI